MNRFVKYIIAFLLLVPNLSFPVLADTNQRDGRKVKADGDKRFALLIGNQSYTNSVGPLLNPTNDVNLIAEVLSQTGFKRDNIKTVIDADRLRILLEVEAYAKRLSSAGDGAIGFFYYAGHGAASGARNYLIPVGVKQLDASIWHRSVALDTVVKILGEAAPSSAQFVILDACRNVLKLGTRGARGFRPLASRRGMLIAFSTAPGEVASDGRGLGGPYARALAGELAKSRLHHLDLFQNVKEVVYRETGFQVPWERNGLLQRVYLSGQPRSQFGASQKPARIVIQSPKKQVSSDSIADVQKMLRQLGMFSGRSNGVMTKGTVRAIRKFQRAQSLKVTGEISIRLVSLLHKAASRRDHAEARPKPDNKETCFKFAGQYICKPAR